MASVFSMTGYATIQSAIASGQLTVELRSVNSRFLDLTLRIPDDLHSLESAIRETIGSRVKRGKMECQLSLKSETLGATSRLSPSALTTLASLQGEALKAFPEARALSVSEILSYPGVLTSDSVDAEQEALKAFPEARALSVSEILSYPGVLTSDSVDAEQVSKDVLDALNRALDAFLASREREGAALAKVLLGYCDNIEGIARDIASRLPDILAAMKSKLEERLSEALTQALSDKSSLTPEDVNERIRAELTLYALRMDVAEEINRLITHVNEVRRVLTAGGPVGRRLDFLMQELNREANTLGSKAVAIEMTNASLDLKLNIEKMREQIQNLE